MRSTRSRHTRNAHGTGRRHGRTRGRNRDGSADRRPTRRRLLAGVGAASIAGIAGCGLFEDPVREFAAETATVSSAALAETGYEEFQVRDDVVTRSYEVGSETADVEVTNRIAEYDRSVEVLGERFRGAVFAALSTPQVDVLGETFNPVGGMSDEELAEMLQERYETIDDVDRTDEYTAELLGTDTTVGVFDARGDPAEVGIGVDLVLHVATAVEAGDDFVVALGGYPAVVDDSDAVTTLLGGVQHPGA